MRGRVIGMVAVSTLAFSGSGPEPGRTTDRKAVEWGAAALKATLQLPIGAMAGAFGVGL